MTRFLTLPVRIGTLIAVIGVIAILSLPTDTRQTLGLRAALFVGYLLPAIAIGAAVGWLTLSWRWFKLVTIPLLVLTTAVVLFGPTIELKLWEQRVDKIFDNSFIGANDEWKIIYLESEENDELSRSDEHCGGDYFLASRNKCFMTHEGKLMIFDPIPPKPKIRQFWEPRT